MDATTKPDRWCGLASLRRMLFWLFAVLAVGETPLSLDEAAGFADGRPGAALSGQARIAVNTPEGVPPADTIAVELATPKHLSLSTLATETGENPFGHGHELAFPVLSGAALAAQTPKGIVRFAQLGFHAQAPPAAI